MAKFYYGGQAVVEGVMMRGQHSAAVAVREPTGDILLHEEELDSALYRSPIARWPFVRGVVLLWEMLILGTRMMMFAATAAMPRELTRPALATSATSGSATATSATAATGTMPGPTGDAHMAQMTHVSHVTEVGALGGENKALLIGTMLFSLAFAIGLFFVLPLGVTSLLHNIIGDGFFSLVVEGVIRLALLIGYLALIGRMPDVQRVFAYHGAEHKSINTFEAGQPLDVAHVRAASRVHTRCGTGFLLIVVVVSIFVFGALGRPAWPLLVASRILLVPVIAAIAYELMRLGASNYRYQVVRWLMAPSLALQGLTTREPDDTQIECAITALERVLRRDGVAVVTERTVA